MGNSRFEHLAGNRRTWAAMACALALLAGCTTTPWGLTSSARLNSATSDAKTAAPSPPKSSGSQADAQSLEQVMRELQQFMALDAAAQDKLMGDLEQVDPTLQPMFLQSFLAEAAYRHREAEREAAEQNQATTAPISLREEPGIRTTLAGEGRESTAALAPPPTSLPIVNLDNGPALSPEPPVMGGIDNSSTTALTAADRLGEAGATPAEPRTLDAGGTPTLRTRLAALRAQESNSAVAPAGAAAAAEGAAPLSESDWQAHLTAAIRSIQQPDTDHRAAEARRILGEALAQLDETAPLAVRHLTFCSEVARFGSFDALPSREFTAGQKVLLYAEVDNLHVESTARGYHWAVNVHGRIFDDRGKRMTDYGSTSAEEYYQTPRHDFFVSKLYYLPRLVPGRYSLQLAIEDTLGRKSGQSSIDFTVKPQGKMEGRQISTEK